MGNSPLQFVQTRAHWKGLVPSILYRQCEPVDFSNPRIVALLPEVIEEMFRTMYGSLGFGLAAPQLGVLWQLAVVDSGWTGVEGGQRVVLINPTYQPMGESRASKPESCLSLPGYRCEVSRPDGILVRNHNLAGELVAFKAEGIHSRVVQHEVDHLSGKLYVDLVDSEELREDPEDGTVRLARRFAEKDKATPANFVFESDLVPRRLYPPEPQDPLEFSPDQVLREGSLDELMDQAERMRKNFPQ